MIIAMLGLFTSIHRANNAAYGMSFGRGSVGKMAQMQRANDITMYKMAMAQQDYYKRLLDKNIKNSFNIFA